MRLRRFLFSGILFLIVLIAPAAGDAQTTIRADVNLVQLSIRVTDSAGRNVVGLGRERFESRSTRRISRSPCLTEKMRPSRRAS
jgi:hypothetical protein